MTRRSFMPALVVALSLAWGAPAPAQTAATPGDVFIVVLEAFPDLDARSLLVREPGRTIVALRPEEATVDALAMSLLLMERLADQEVPVGQGVMVPITGFTFRTPPRGEKRRELEGILQRLEHAPIQEVGTLGRGRWIRYR